MILDKMRTRAVFTLFSLAALAASAWGQTTGAASSSASAGAGFPVRLVPNARSIAVSFDVRNVAPALYAIKPSPWEFEGEARLWLSTDNGATWKRQPDFVREQVDRVLYPNMEQSPRMSSRIFGLAPGGTYRYRITFSGGQWPQSLVKEGECKTQPVPVLGPNVTPVTVEATETTATLKAKILAAFAVEGTDVVELRSSLPNPTDLLRIRASVGTINPPSGTPTRWKGLRVAKGHNIVFDGGLPGFDVVNAGVWVPFVDEARGITAAMGVYKSTITVPRTSETWVYYERATDQPAVQSFNGGRGWRDGDDPALTGFDIAYPTPIVNVAGGKINLTEDANYRVHMRAVISGNSNPSLNREWEIGWSENYKSTELRDPATGKTISGSLSGTGGTLAPTKPQSSMTLRIGRNMATHLYEDDQTGQNRGYLYLRLHDGVNPNTTRIKVTDIAEPIRIQGTSSTNPLRYFSTENLHFEYFGANQGGKISFKDVDTIWLRNTRLVNTGTFVSSSGLSNNIVIDGCDFRQRGSGPDTYPNPIPIPRWRSSKTSSRYETLSLGVWGVGISFMNNHIEGPFNGWSSASGAPRSFPQGWDTENDLAGKYPEGIEFDSNSFLGIGDDPLEPEFFVVNFSATNNTFDKCYKGVSLAPALGGPYYILRNRWHGDGVFSQSDATDQSFLKFGNVNATDSGYKLYAHNTIVNSDSDPSAQVLNGIMGSGESYNNHAYNNYVAADTLMYLNYGGMGYPHFFDYNRFRSARYPEVTGYPDDNWGVASMERPWRQGDPVDGKRVFRTFEDWQRGIAHIPSRNMPGVALPPAAIPVKPVVVALPPHRDYPGQPPTVTWMHDPHSTWSKGKHELVAPQKGNFDPISTRNWKPGRVLYGINRDVGPEWARYEETSPTIGAVPAKTAGSRENIPPTVSVDSLATGTVGLAIAVVVTFEDSDGTAEIQSAVVTDPKGATVASRVESVGEGVASVIFTPAVAGPHPVKVTVRDDKGATAQDVATVNVISDLPPDGQLKVVLFASKVAPKPGEPVVYTIVVTNPTDRPMRDAVMRQSLPREVTLNMASLSVDGRAAGGSFTDDTLQVSLGTVAPGGKRTITVTAFVR